MSMMGKVEAPQLMWFAARIKSTRVGGMHRVTVGGEFEAYRNNRGQVRKRRIDGTGKTVFYHEHRLRAAGFEVFLPVKKKLKTKNRFTKEKHLVSFPLLVGWIFVGVPAGFDPVRGDMLPHNLNRLLEMDLVSGLLGADGRPALIPQKDIHQMMKRWGGGELSAPMHKWSKTDIPFEPGDMVRVVSGPFAGFSSKIVGIKGETLTAMVQLFGRDVPITFGLDQVDEVEQV